LEHWLEGLSRKEVIVALTTCLIIIAVADYLTPASIGFGSLYTLPICFAACWLTPRLAMCLAGMAAILTVVTNFVVLEEKLSLGFIVSELALYFATFASLISIVSFVHYRFERKWSVNRHDEMTGALIRSEFDDQARAMMTDAAVQGRSLLLAYLDLDDFKSVNDYYGHEAGDRVLQAFGARGLAILRREDCFGRIGGDEFAVMMPLVSSTAGRNLAEALHQRFTAALAITGYSVTCSMGAVVILPEDSPTLEEVARKVDRIMYAVKRGGKNSFRFATTASLLPEQELPLFADAQSTGEPSALWIPQHGPQPVQSYKPRLRTAHGSTTSGHPG